MNSKQRSRATCRAFRAHAEDLHNARNTHGPSAAADLIASDRNGRGFFPIVRELSGADVRCILRVGCVDMSPEPASLRRPVSWFLRPAPVTIQSARSTCPRAVKPMHTVDDGRRQFLKLGIAGSIGFAFPAAGYAVVPGAAADRALEFYNTHTDERLSTTYWAGGQYVPGALADINFILRDFRANEIKAIDVALLDLLHRLHASLDTSEPFHVISGYRTAATNAMLHSASEGVALHSLHIEGMAIDIRVPGRDLPVLRRAALALRGGGVGYYPHSDFVHVDVGRVRTW